MNIKCFGSSSKGNCYLLEHGENRLMLECGLPYKKIKEHMDYDMDIDGCLVSHEHMDHAKALVEMSEAGVECFASRGTIDATGAFITSILTEKKWQRIGRWYVYPFNVEHDANEPLGFLICIDDVKLLFATDTYFIRYTFKGLTHLMIEANYDEDNIDDCKYRRRLRDSHMSIQTVLSYLGTIDQSKLKNVYLMHLSDYNANEKEFGRLAKEITKAKVEVF